jgi:peptide/nickel transport system permease protein
MTSYVVRRLVYAILTFLGITVATFALIHAVPGDPVTFYLSRAGMNVPEEILQSVRREYHLDEPLLVQYVYWLRGVVTLDFGRSVIDQRPVVERILERLPGTLQLNVLAFALSALIGIPIGLWSAARAGRLAERASAVGFFLLYSLPSFWVALMLAQLLAMRLQILPLFGMTSDGYEMLSFGERVLDRLEHLVLPVITLSYAQIAFFARFSKSALTEVIRQDFITAARAKGATESAIVWRHAFRNALIPMITLLGLTIPYLISGSVIVEQIFQWDGIGRLYVDSIFARDYPTVMALTVTTAIVTLLATLLADLLYAAADPRIRIQGRER